MGILYFIFLRSNYLQKIMDEYVTNVMKSLLLSAILSFSACNNSVEQMIEKPFDEEISYKYVIKVGKDKEYQTVAAAAAAAKDSVLIEIDAGVYSGDVARWSQNEVYIRAVGGEVVLDANGKSYGGKGIWEIDGGRMKVEGITFQNARVPDHNGAGIRLTKGELMIDKCRFLHNEMGILTGNTGGTLLITNSEFGYGGYGDGFSHNLYVGYIDKFVVTGSYFHHARQGHLLKSRAKISIVKYCRITDENDERSQSSYELDFPSGGINIVVGNIIQQSVNSPNSAIVDFAAEVNDYWADNVLYMSHNTVVNNKVSNNCSLVSPSNKIQASSIILVNNLIDNTIVMPESRLLRAETGNERFSKDELNSNYTPKPVLYNQLTNKIATDINKYLTKDLTTQNISLIPTEEYNHPCSAIRLPSTPKIAGALQRSE
jgi:hypothetical protein